MPVMGQRTFEKEIQFDAFASGSSLIQTSDGGYMVGSYKYGATGIDQNLPTPCLLKFGSGGEILWQEIGSIGFHGQILTLTSSSDGYFFAEGYLNIDSVGRVFVMKFDSIGNTIWMRSYRNQSPSPCLSPCKDGGCIIVGYDGNTSAPFAIRIGSNGSVKWSEHLIATGPAPFTPRSMMQLNDTAYIIIGYTTEGKANLSIMELHLNSEVVAYQTILTNSAVFGNSSCITSDGGFVVCGTTEVSQDNKNIYAAKFDDRGSLLWSKEIDGFGFEEGQSIVEGDNGDLVILCFGNPTGVMILQMDKDGKGKILKTLGGATDFFSNSIIHSSDGGFVFSGKVGNLITKTTGGMILVKLDSTLNGCNLTTNLFTEFNSGQLRPGSGLTLHFGVVLDTPLFTMNRELNGTIIDLCDQASVKMTKVNEDAITLFPNPLISSTSFTISINASIPPAPYTIFLRDLLGNTIKHEKIILTRTKQDILFDASECLAGVYFVELQNETGVVARAKLVKE